MAAMALCYAFVEDPTLVTPATVMRVQQRLFASKLGIEALGQLMVCFSGNPVNRMTAGDPV
jgi:hypothetical protein